MRGRGRLGMWRLGMGSGRGAAVGNLRAPLVTGDGDDIGCGGNFSRSQCGAPDNLRGSDGHTGNWD